VSDALRDVPTDVIAGGDAAMQAATLAQWIEHKPESDRWAVLAGGAWMSLPSAPGVTVRALPPGCACCTGNVLFRVTLVRLLGATRPDRLIITLAPEDHVDRAIALLRSEFSGVLALERVAR
jgi:hypothetical protein